MNEARCKVGVVESLHLQSDFVNIIYKFDIWLIRINKQNGFSFENIIF